MIGCYNYTVVLTYIGTVFGFAGMTYSINGNLKMALVCLMIAGFCDMFDGRIASTMKRTKQETRFGIQIDSLSDLICFGALPATIVFNCSKGGFIHILICALYLLCALIRLAWFNVDEEERQDRESTGRETYLGLPVTSAAMLFPFFAGLSQVLGVSLEIVSVCLAFCVAVAFISPFRLKKPGGLGKIIMLLCGVAVFTLVMIGVKA